MTERALSVRQLNLYVRSLIEGDPKLSNVTVAGELSNFKNHYSSGHFYFTLKDKDAAVQCVMFASNARRVKFIPEDGLEVVLKARVSLYEKDGKYQLYAEEMFPLGLGDIALKFEQTKEKLQKEGLFDSDSKRPLPKFPKKIAVVTSKTGAAIRDILNILSRRWPLADILLCPVSVQGESAAYEMIAALDKLYTLSDIDIIIIGRGGGSAEDLSAFNDEKLARKIYESPVPVISAVGHETDFSISDFVADLRAPTPSAAAELAVPDIYEINNRITELEKSLKNRLSAKFNFSKLKFDSLLSNRFFMNPKDIILTTRNLELDRLFDKISATVKENFKTKSTEFSAITALLDGLSPLKILSRGYSVVTKDNKTITNSDILEVGDKIDVTLNKGHLSAEIKEII